MAHLLTRLLEAHGTPQKPRYTLQEVGDILGMNRNRVRLQIVRGDLQAVKTSPKRWGYVLHEDLASFVAVMNGGAQ
jgi:DNA-directed RNA polymerase sigma subunit (sigma70/sigma32)